MMYAIVEIAGQQYKVKANQRIYTNRLEGETGNEVTFDKVLLVDNNGDVKIGAPTVDGASVKAKILAHLKDNTKIVFKKKKRKGYKKKNGHRQPLTQVEIQEIV